ncbi:MAG TPA: tetratricopeptide repeat protein [Ktedonobacteraceae bacterium]|nr:tetratricopeptide repeat protein [Ktedonobacteraceae bacterium]
MAHEPAQNTDARKDFFISYTNADRAWAEWIAWYLEQAGYATIIQAWDFHAGKNFVQEMDQATRRAERTIAVLSPDYFHSTFTPSEWQAAFRHDPTSEQSLLLPIRVRTCDVEGLLGAIVYLDLVGLNEQSAQEKLFSSVSRQRAKPDHAPAFPGTQLTSPPPAFPGTTPSAIWHVPFSRNPFFAGREEELTHLHEQLQQSSSAAIGQAQAISGLGGVGKTQVALEYAYRHRQEYRAVLWVHAGTLETLNASYSELARQLDLPEKDAREQEIVIQAICAWLRTHDRWLLMLDNLDDPSILFPPDEQGQQPHPSPFLPTQHDGYLLITTRAADLTTLGLGMSHAYNLEVLSPEQGGQLLLSRAGWLNRASEQERETARQLAEELGGLALALDQAGAYLAETSISLTDYLSLFRQRSYDLLKQHRGQDYPHAVATTWDLSFQRVELRSPAAAELLRFCAFLAPDAIPEELFTKNASHLGKILASAATDPLRFNEAIATLRAHSLLTRDPVAHTLSVHRLVQAILRNRLSPRQRTQRMKRAILTLNAASPDPDFAYWPTFERLLPHALLCATWIEQASLEIPDAAHLLNQTGSYLYDRARYIEAEPLLQRALAIREQQFGSDHPDTATSLNNLAVLYASQGKHEQARPLLQRALAIREQQLGSDHPSTASSLNSLAGLYAWQGKYTEAEPLYQRALAICEQHLGPAHPDTAASLNGLALLYTRKGKDKLAEPLYQRALVICEQHLGSAHPSTANSLNNLAKLYVRQGKHTEAEPLYQRALDICELHLGPAHPDTATSLNNLAGLYAKQGKNEQAEPLYQRALDIREKQLGPAHPNTATSLNNLAKLYVRQGKYTEAELLYQRALEIYDQQLGSSHPNTATSRNNLAILYAKQEKYEQAEALYQRALETCEQHLGPAHPNTATSLNNLAKLYARQGKDEQAEPLYQHALTIRERQLGPDHPDTANCLSNLADLYAKQGKYTQAEPLYQRALTIYNQQLGPAHPNTATSLNSLAEFYTSQGKYEQAEPLYQHALAISEQQLGPNHPDTATSLNNLAELYRAQRKYEQAEPLYQRALAICEQRLGPDHPHTRLVRENYTELLHAIERETKETEEE